MKADRKDLLLADVMAEYIAVFEGDWKPKTKRKYEDDFRRLREWLEREGQPLTTAALDFGVLLKYVGHLKEQPAVSGVWRGDPEATARVRRSSTARTVSLNTVNSYMRPIKSLCQWARDQASSRPTPFGRGRGIAFFTFHLLTVPGRVSGRLRTTPVSPLFLADGTYLMSTGETEWVKNARAAGWGLLARGKREQRVELAEVPMPDRVRIVREFAACVPAGVPFFVRLGVVDAPGDPAAFERAASRLAVF